MKPGVNEEWGLKNKFYSVFVTAVGWNCFVAIDYNDLCEKVFDFSQLERKIEREKTKKLETDFDGGFGEGLDGLATS